MSNLVRLGLVAAIAAAFGHCNSKVRAQSGDQPPRRLTFQPPTLGGSQFWTDQMIHGEWRIQRNMVTGHHRLLDHKNKRRSWGSYDKCRKLFNELKQQGDVEPMKPAVVIVVHGLGRTRGAMQGMADYLAEKGGYTAINVTYASTRDGIGGHAKALASIIKNLEGVREIHLVAHSMGNIVIRHYLADHTDPASGRQGDPRIGRIVMLAPPNQGAAMARKLLDNKPLQLVMGFGGQELGKQWDEFSKNLATPAMPFGIVAGNWKLAEDESDWAVTVEETRLPGAADFIVISSSHTTIMNHADTRTATLRFIKRGFFVSEDKRQPIPRRESP